MYRNTRLIQSAFLLLLVVIAAASFFPYQPRPVHAQDTPQGETLVGWFQVVWASSPPGVEQATPIDYLLTTEEGQSYRLDVDAQTLQNAGGIMALNGQRVLAQFDLQAQAQSEGGPDALSVQSLSLLPGGEVSAQAVSGSQPWVSILCKFNDVGAEPKSLPYFINMYNNAFPGLDHYWRDQSYGMVNLTGSTAVGWFTLPRSRSAYFLSNGSFNLNLAAQDCTAVADAHLYFPAYKGINLMFNDNLDGFAWGGFRWLTLDGVYGRWNLTWVPPWAYNDITVLAHEMGHGFGLPHSSGNYGKVYDNVWDVMSDAYANCAKSTHVTFGCLGQHTIAYHKDILGWIPASKKYTVPYTTGATPSQTTSNRYFMAQVPILGAGNRFYTVEVRNFYGYDVKLPGKAVIIHNVDTTRNEPAQVIDTDNNGNTGDSGAIWTVGETFQDTTNQVSIAVLAASGEDFQVRVTNGTQVATFWIEPLAPKPTTFTDVPQYFWAWQFIESLYASGVTGGCGTAPLRYCPSSTVTRDQMAVFLLRGANGGSYTPPAVGSTTGFADVPTTFWAAAWIKQLAAAGITSGCGGGNYCPANPVTRDQMAFFLLRAKYGSTYAPPPVGASTGFADVPTTHWAAAWIKQLAAEGITGGCGGGNYCPGNPVTRDQMAVFLVRTFGLP